MAKTSHNISEWANAGFQDFISKDMIEDPNTLLTNRAKVPSGLIASMGNERIVINSLKLLPEEVSPTGKPVYGIDSGDPRVRFWGEGIVPEIGSTAGGGFRVRFENGQDAICEVFFYGTGLNANMRPTNGARDFDLSVDGGATTVFTPFPTNGSEVQGSRGYRPNVRVNIVDGLPLGWHTVRLERRTSTPYINGFEVINNSPLLCVSAGSGFANTQKQTLLSDSTIDFKPAGMGVKGGRVLTYLLNGSLGQVFQDVDATERYLTNTDHSNEELLRVVNFREFGVGRSDDFSTLSTVLSDRGFVLDDGSTALIGNDVQTDGDDLRVSGGAAFLEIHFTGTGLDIGLDENSTSSEVAINVTATVNGSNQGSITRSKRTKICSGLPYGTHVVRFSNPSGNTTLLSNFYIYQPKKPTLPSGALQLSDYNVTADYVANTSAGTNTIGTGLIRKNALRELMLVGSSWTNNFAAGALGGFNLGSVASGEYAEFKFFGTGFEARFDGSSGINTTVSVDGNSDLSGFTTSVYDSNTASFNASTGLLNGNPNPGAGLSVAGLSLGWHTVRFTRNTTVNFTINALDIISPIHINDPSLKVGSLSLTPQKNISPMVKENSISTLGSAKALLHFDQINNDFFENMNISAVISLGTGHYRIYFSTPFKRKPVIVFGTRQNRAIGAVREDTLAMTSYIEVINKNIATDANEETPHFMMAVFGELVDE